MRSSRSRTGIAFTALAGLAVAAGGWTYEDLRSPSTTPDFMFITPNLCNDGHDATCVGTNTEGGHQGGLVGADLWLKHWSPIQTVHDTFKSTPGFTCPAAAPGT